MPNRRGLARLVVVDTAPLRLVPGYRWYFVGTLLAHVGRQLTVVAVPYQLYRITGSTLAVGLLGLAQLVPLLLVSLVGGALADAVDRKRLLSLSQVFLALTALGLFWNSVLSTPAIWPLFVLTGLNAMVSAIDSPARLALVPGLVGRALVPSALALNSTLTNTAKSTIPALGGLTIAAFGLPVSYGLEACAFVLSAVMLWRIPSTTIEGGGRRFSLSSIAEGINYLRPQKVIKATFLLDLNAMVFGMPSALFPALGTNVIGGGAAAVGLLYAAPGVGALVGAATSGWVSAVRRQGTLALASVLAWGGAITVVGLTKSLKVALVMLAIAGAADVVSTIVRQTIVQLSVPDSLRGRLSSIHLAVSTGGPRLGDLEAGLVAAVTTVRFSVVSGGLACILGTLAIARWSPRLRRYVYEPQAKSGPGREIAQRG